jgi:hypothetical protein
MISPVQALAGIDEVELDEETTGLFPSGNARWVFQLPYP